MKLQGIFPPITTPFDHEGNIYPAKLQHNVEKWNRTTLSGYVVLGSTGESVLLTESEKTTVWEQVAKHAAAEKLLIAGTGAESVIETVMLTNRAAETSATRPPWCARRIITRTCSIAATRRCCSSARWPTG
jgi:4-hydroxy-2-oxoglutarate aldolase